MQKTESEVSSDFVTLISPYFRLFPEVYLQHPAKGRIRIDFIGQPTCGRWQGNIGFELKRDGVGVGNFSDWSNAVAQAIDYSQSRIISDKIGGDDWFGRSLKYVFLFPSPFSIYGPPPSQDPKGYSAWARGQMRLAGKFGVGAIEFVEVRQDWVFTLGTEPAYWLSGGPTHLALKHAVGERIGASR